MSLKFKIWIAISIILPILLSYGCDDRNIDALEKETGLYSVYGTLNLHETPNYVRVKNLKEVFFSDSAEDFDGTVTFEDLQSGNSWVLEDTVVNFSGNYTHNFIIEQPLQAGRDYRLTVESPDGITVSSSATTPNLTAVTKSWSDTLNGALKGIPCGRQTEFVFKNVEEPEKVVVEIGFQYNDATHWGKMGKVKELQHRSYADEMFVTMSPRLLLIEVFPPPEIDNPSVNPVFLSPEVLCHELDSGLIQFRYTHYGREWDNIDPSKGPFNPLESPDVQDGLGFFGSYRKGLYTFYVDTSLAE